VGWAIGSEVREVRGELERASWSEFGGGHDAAGRDGRGWMCRWTKRCGAERRMEGCQADMFSITPHPTLQESGFIKRPTEDGGPDVMRDGTGLNPSGGEGGSWGWQQELRCAGRGV